MAPYEADKYFSDKEEKAEPAYKKQDYAIKKKRDDDIREIRIRFKPITVERVLFISLIILLLGYIIVDKSLYPCTAENAKDAKTENKTKLTKQANNTNAIKKENQAQTNLTQNKTNAITAQVVYSPKNTTQETQNTTPNLSNSTNANASILFSSSDVEIEGDYPSVKMKSISFKIKNNAGAALSARVDAGWYEETDGSKIKDRVCGSKSVILSANEELSSDIAEFDCKYLSSETTSETIKLRLYEASTGTLLDAKTAAITT